MNYAFLYFSQIKYPLLISFVLVIILIIFLTILATYYAGLPGLIIGCLILLIFILVVGAYDYSMNRISDLTVLDNAYEDKPRVPTGSRVVISLTTIPSRIDTLQYTIKSILRQNYRVDEIYIWVPEVTIKGLEYEIPDELLNMKNVKVNRCEKDFGPSTKLLYTLLSERDLDTKIIVIDDDVVYKPTLIEKLIITSDIYPDAAITGLGIDINPNIECFELSDLFDPKTTKVDRLFGLSGFLVKPRFFHDGHPVNGDCFDYDNVPDEVKWVDDIWFSYHLKMRNIPIYRLPLGVLNLPAENIQSGSTSLHVDYNGDYKNHRIACEYFDKLN